MVQVKGTVRSVKLYWYAATMVQGWLKMRNDKEASFLPLPLLSRITLQCKNCSSVHMWLRPL